MRVSIINFNNIGEDNIRLREDINKSIFIDFDQELDLASYCLSIRNYDLVIINYKKENHNKLTNCFYELKQKETNFKLCFFVSERDLPFFEKEMPAYKLKYIILDKNKHLSIDSLTQEISSLIESYFLTIPLVNNISFDHGNRVMKIETTHGIFETNIKKEINYKVLLYFVRHYQETISVEDILSAISKEPEYMHNSPIETAISDIRKILKNLLQKEDINPIKAYKRVGYQFNINNI